MNGITYTIFNSVSKLPSSWDDVAQSNIFLQTTYLTVLDKSAPVNMHCFYIGIFENSELIGVALAQYLDANKLESFGERDKCVKTFFRNFALKNFASHTLVIGDNMITGQNGYAFSKNIDFRNISDILLQATNEIIQHFKTLKTNIHLVTFKDYYKDCADELRKHHFKTIFEFSVQPNMILYINKNWKNTSNYIDALTKKYRDQYKRARKKCNGIVVKNLSLAEIISNESTIYNLYHHVALNAPFNTFFLAENHFSTMKNQCNERFLLFGYFLNEKLVGFHTLLLNGNVLETYFLGYDKEVQKENMLYLNMLYNMTEFGIENGFEKIIFGRTALEIKSSIGATAIDMYGFIFHTNKLINSNIKPIFNKIEPKVVWQERSPFK